MWLADVGKIMVEEDNNEKRLQEVLEQCLEENRQDVFVQNVVEMARPLAVALKMSGRARQEVRDRVKKKMLKMAKRAKTAKKALVCCAGSIATNLIHDYEEPEKWGGP